MTVLEWDKVGERFYQTGLDRGVLYLKDGTVVPWNGLTSVDDGTNSELKSYYLDGVKILDHVTPGEFVGKLSAFTYPEEFDQVLGIVSVAPGLSFHEQPPKSFNLSYRTKISNDLNENYGYKLHLLYDLKAISDSHTYESIGDKSSASEFSWSLSGTPPHIVGNKPTVHVSIDSTAVDSGVLQAIEDILYGTESMNARFPTITEIETLFGGYGLLIIVDHEDGTWSAIDIADAYISMIDATTFEIDFADAVYLDADTYEISSTT